MKTHPSIELSGDLRVVSAFGIKGGCGKSTITLMLAAGLKRLYPSAKVGLIDMTTEQATLSAVFAPELEAKGQGWWAVVKAYLDEVEREANPRMVHDAIHRAVVPLMVLPDATSEEGGIIEFMGCGKRQLRSIEGHTDLTGAKSMLTGAGVLEEVKAALGWDWAVIDLPPSTKEVGSRMLLGCCSAVAVTAGLTHRDDLAGYPAMIEEVRRLEIEPAGFLLNRYLPGDKYSEAALLEVNELSRALNVPRLGLIRERQTVKSSREPYGWSGERVSTAVGLYVAREDSHLNSATREGIRHTIHEVESVAKAVVAAIAATENLQKQGA